MMFRFDVSISRRGYATGWTLESRANSGGVQPSSHYRARAGARVHMRVHVNKEVGRLDTFNNDAVFERPACGTTFNGNGRMSKGALRGRMPTVAAWIDDLRAAFGEEVINKSIRAGMNGLDDFYAIESGVEIGTNPLPPGYVVSGDDLLAHMHSRSERK